MTMEYMDGVTPEEEFAGGTAQPGEETQQPDTTGEGIAEEPGDWYQDDKGEDSGPSDEGSWPPDDDGQKEELPSEETSGDGDCSSDAPAEPEPSEEQENLEPPEGGGEDGDPPDSGDATPPPEDPPKKPVRRRATAAKTAADKTAATKTGAATPRKRATAPKKATEAEPEPVKAPTAASPPAQPEPDPVDTAEKSLADRKRQALLQRQQRRREREHLAILDVDGTSMVEDSDGFDEKSAAVFQAANTRSICCGPITGVKFSRGTGHYVEAEYKGFRVLIPFGEMDIVLDRQSSDNDNDYENKTITAIRNMVGAEIEFIILNIDENEHLAIATRRLATEQRRREVLNGTNRAGEYHIYPGRKVVARILDVHPFYAWVEVAGWRTRLSASELRAEYVEDMTNELANGQRITVTISELTRDRRGIVTDMRISMRDDEKEKRDLEKAMAGINIGDIIRCEVVGRSSKVIRLKTHNGARAFCYIAKGLHGRYIPKIDESVTIKVIKKTENPRTGNPVIQGNILRRSVKPGLL